MGAKLVKKATGVLDTLTAHFQKHKDEYSKFGDIPNVDIGDVAKYSARAKEIANAADKSNGVYRVFSQVQGDGHKIRIVLKKDTNELAMWDETVDELTTLYRPGADTAANAAEMLKKSEDLVTKKLALPSDPWVEVK